MCGCGWVSGCPDVWVCRCVGVWVREFRCVVVRLWVYGRVRVYVGVHVGTR